MTIPPIPDVIAYGHCEVVRISLGDDLTVSTCNDRIEVAHPDLGSLSLTTEQSIALRERLEQAERDIDAAEPCENGSELLEPGRCDCCGRAMAVGEQVAVHWDERLGDVVMHDGKCPEPEGWWNGAPECLPRPFEEAFAMARDLIATGWTKRVSLVRVREAHP